jgi:thymidylate synthase (FAD)
MEVKLISYPVIDPAQLCGKAAAICYDSKNYESALKHSAGAGHTSVLEHASFTFEISGISRATLAQLTRHRIASFSVQSQRYVKLDNPEFVIPETIRNSELYAKAESAMRCCMDLYKMMIDAGIPAEDARFVTPQAVPTNVIMTMNCRELLHFFRLRTCNRAQWEIRQLADEMLRICRKKSPEIFGNAGADCVNGVCHEKKPCGKPRSSKDWE